MPIEPPEPSKAKPVTLFLSYAHADEAKARRISSALRQAGYEVWWDEMIEGGAAYARSISAALQTADVVIVLWSATSVESDWVRDEAAQGRDRQRLVPLRIDGTRPPLGFGQYQAINFKSWRGRRESREFMALQRAIGTAIGQEVSSVPRRRKGIDRRTALIAGSAATVTAVAGGTFLALDRGWFGSEEEQPSIAVLPFRNLSGDPEQAYFSEGLTEEVRAALVRLNAMRVLAATSSEKASEENEDVKSIARELGVGFLLGGSVRKSGNLFRIATELTDGKSGFSLWSTSIDRPINDIFAIQAEIARMVAQALSIRIATEEPAPGGTSNVEAFEHYLKGKSLYHLARDEVTDRQALAHYDLAIASDPRFAMAYAARARVLASIAAGFGKTEELKPLYASAITSARRAVELAPNLADGHLALGYVLFSGQLDVKGAAPSYKRAYELGQGNADIGLLYALYCSRAGRPDEARDAVARALLLDPINARAHRASGSIEYAARRFENAYAPLRRALQLNPKITNVHGLIAYCLLQQGKFRESKTEFQAEPVAAFRLSGLAIVEDKLGNRAAAEKAMADLVAEMGDAALYQQAEVMSQWGRADDAVARLWKARTVGDSGLIYLATDPLLDPVRQHSEFVRLLKELRLT